MAETGQRARFREGKKTNFLYIPISSAAISIFSYGFIVLFSCTGRIFGAYFYFNFEKSSLTISQKCVDDPSSLHEGYYENDIDNISH